MSYSRHRIMSDEGALDPVMGITRTYLSGTKVAEANEARPLAARFNVMKTCDDCTNPGPPYRSGRGLMIRSIDWNTGSVAASGSWRHRRTPTSGWEDEYTGDFCCTGNPHLILNSFGSLPSLNGAQFDASFENCETYGPTGWAKARPAQPGADLGVFLGEIREIPTMLRDTALFLKNSYTAFKRGAGHASKHAASSWLGLNFGWVPFVSDLRKFAKTYQNLEKMIQQIYRDNGHWVRRRRSVISDTETVSDTGWVNNASWHAPVLNAYWYQLKSPNRWARLVVTRERRVWFVGAFRYWIPDIGTPKWRRKAIRKLYGGNLNPELVWELTPFSWLVDWMTNVGDNLSNLDNGLAENLVAKYAYIMESESYIGTYMSKFLWADGVGLPDNMVNQMTITQKSRTYASPFGFALSSENFTAKQWSLLGAVGLQRAKFISG